MLDLMRRHVGWGLKVVLGVIIVTFVFFFGYTKIREESREATAIQVGDEAISFSLYRFFFNNQYERLQESMKGQEISDFLVKNIQQMTQQQLIQRSLIKQFAKSLGITVSDQELAQSITKEKDFDPVSYKDFLNNFYYRNAFSYEELIREDLLVQKFQNWAQKMEKGEEGVVSQEPSWTFEKIQLVGEEKRSLAQEIQQSWNQGKEVTPLLKKNNIKSEKVKPITIKDRFQIFPAGLTLDEYFSLFSLSKPKSAPSKPIAKEKNFLIVRLLEKKSSKNEKGEDNFSTPAPLIDIWFRDFATKTKIESFIKPEEL